MNIGIDFGTSFSLATTNYLGNNITLMPAGKYAIPSVFYYNHDDGILIGDEALEARQGREAINLKREVKLDLDKDFVADGKTFTSKQIVASILSYVKNVATNVAQTKLINEKIDGVVISVPAEFKNNEKELIKQAAMMSVTNGGPGFNVLGIIKEPVAAALSYFNDSNMPKDSVLVYDLGGGTCDVAIVKHNSALDEKFDVVDSAMLRVGGKDFDSKIISYIFDQIEIETGKNYRNNPQYIEKVKRAAISIKHSFSEKLGLEYKKKAKARIEINGQVYTVAMTSSAFEEICMPLINQTTDLVRKVINKNHEQKVSKIICVGGSSNMPIVMSALKKEFPNLDISIYEPEKAISNGAAIYAKSCTTKPIVRDIASFTYGTDCKRFLSDGSAEHYIYNMIFKGDKLPIKSISEFITIVDNQERIAFSIYESQSMLEEDIYKAPLNKKSILDVKIPIPKKSKKGYTVRMQMTLSNDGLLEIYTYDAKGNDAKGQVKLNF